MSQTAKEQSGDQQAQIDGGGSREHGPQHQQLVLGFGGLILDNRKENQDVLRDLQEKIPPLGPDELLVIAKLYKKYPTNMPVGNHFALLSQGKRFGPQWDQELFTEYAQFNVWDNFEDSNDGLANNPRHEASDPGEVPPFVFARLNEGDDPKVIQLEVRRVPVQGVELLVETLTIAKNDVKVSQHYIIGVAPTLTTVPD
jgi:hypothetical protein